MSKNREKAVFCFANLTKCGIINVRLSKLNYKEKFMTKTKSLLTSIVVGIFVLVACVFGFAGCGATVTEIRVTIDNVAVKQDTTAGAKFEPTGLKVKVLKSDKSETEIKAEEYKIVSTPDISKLGVQKFEVKYTSDNKEYSAFINVWVYGEFKQISVGEDSYSKTIERNTTFDKTTLEVYAEYACDEKEGNYKKLLSSSEFTVSELDTSTLGKQNVTISYQNANETDSKTIEIEVIPGFEISGFAMPLSITDYSSNSQLKNTYTSITSGEGAVKGFEVTGNAYKVGSYNEFWFQPTLSTKNMATKETRELTEFPMRVKVYQKNDTTYNELTGENLTNMVKYDSNKHSFKFTSNANEKTFKIEAFPAYDLTETEKTKVGTLSFEFEVVDGYNVYNAHDLSAIDNANMADKWTALKTEWGIPLNVTTNTFILHNSISITDDSIPAGHFWTAEELAKISSNVASAVGSLKDSSVFEPDELGNNPVSNAYASIYKRKIVSGDKDTNGENFVIEGNYFRITAQNLSLIKLQDNNETMSDDTTAITTHTSLFSVVCKDENAKNVATIKSYVGENATEEEFNTMAQKVSAKANFNNIEFIGNSPKTDTSILSGGVLLYKTLNTYTTFNNCLSQRWFLSFLTEIGGQPFSQSGFLALTVNQTNVYDAYNTMVYSSGGSVNIKGGSHLIGAGGPVVIGDSIRQADGSDEGYYPYLYVDSTSVIESYIAGTEGWFNQYEVAKTLIAQIKAQDEIFRNGLNGTSKTVRNSAGLLNLKVIIMDTNMKGNMIAGEYTRENAILPFTMGNSYYGTTTTINYVTKLMVMSGMLSNSDIKSAVENYMQQTNISSRVQALDSMIAFAKGDKPSDANLAQYWENFQTIKNTYDTNYDQLQAANNSNEEAVYKASPANAVKSGIVYIGANGMVCVPQAELNTQDTSASWAVAPNEDLWKECNGEVYISVYGQYGGVLNITDYTAPSA